jgi:hypothetical protein
MSLFLVSVPLMAYGKTTGSDPGASAALGAIYFSSVLDDAGFGSGGSGGGSGLGVSTGSGGDGSALRSSVGRSVPPGSGGGPGNGGTGTGDSGTVVPGSSPVSLPPSGSGKTTEIFGDMAPGNNHGGPSGGVPSGSGNPVDGFVLPLPHQLPDPGAPSSDEIIPSASIVSEVRILQVPEPTTMSLFGLGIAGLVLLIGRKKRAAV